MNKPSFFKRTKNKFLAVYDKNIDSHLSSLKKFSVPSYLLSFNRHTVAKGVALGLFLNFLPIPLQSVIALSLAVLIRANIPLAVSLTWINNPFTFIPINLFIFKMGSYFTGEMMTEITIPSVEWHLEGVNQLWKDICSLFVTLGKTYVLGLCIVSSSAALIGFLCVHLGWLVADILKYKKKENP